MEGSENVNLGRMSSYSGWLVCNSAVHLGVRVPEGLLVGWSIASGHSDTTGFCARCVYCGFGLGLAKK